MKKFFKALALVLALTLVIGTIPASAAATIDESKVMTKKILYIGGTKGYKMDGETKVFSKYKESVSYARLLGITKDDARELGVTAEASDTKILEVGTDKVKVKGLGVATLTLTVGTKTYSVEITGKKTATDATVIFGADFLDKADGSSVTLNKEYELSLPRMTKDAEGNTVRNDSDNRALIITDKDGKDVTASIAGSEIPDAKDAKKHTRRWKVKFTAAGEYTITANAYQSKKFPGVTATKSIKVTAKEATPVDLYQVASNAFVIEFEEGASIDEKKFQAAISYEDSIYSKIDGKKVPFSLIDSVGVVLDKDGKEITNKWKVTMKSNFVGGTEYHVVYKDNAEKEWTFKATGTSLDDVASVTINTTDVPAATDYDVSYTILNKDGIDITPAIEQMYVTLDIISDYAFPTGAFAIYFSEADKTAKVTATVHTGHNADGSEKTVKSAEATIKSFDGAVIKDIKYSVVRDPWNYQVNEWFDMSKSVTHFAIDDNAHIQIAIKNAANQWQTLGEFGITSVRSADANYFAVKDAVSEDAANLGLLLEGTNAGDSAVVLYKEKADGTEYPVKTLPVTVWGSRRVTSVNVTVDQAYLNQGFVDDEITFTMTVKDQYGENLNALNGVEVEQVAANKNDANIGELNLTAPAVTPLAAVAGQTGVYRFVVKSAAITGTSAVAATKTKNFQLQFKATGRAWESKTRVIGFTGGNLDPAVYAATSWQVKASNTALETNIVRDNAVSDAMFRLWGYNGKFVVTHEDLYEMNRIPSQAMKTADVVNATHTDVVTVSGNAIFVYVIKHNSKVLDITDIDAGAANHTAEYARGLNMTNWPAAGAPVGAVEFTSFLPDTIGTPGDLYKLPGGSYTVSFYKVTAGATKSNVNSLGSKVLNVTDNQLQGAFTKVKDITTGTDDASVLECFKFTFQNGLQYVNPDVTIKKSTTSDVNKTVYVESVYLTFTHNKTDAYLNEAHNYTYTISIPVNKLLKIAQ